MQLVGKIHFDRNIAKEYRKLEQRLKNQRVLALAIERGKGSTAQQYGVSHKH